MRPEKLIPGRTWPLNKRGVLNQNLGIISILLARTASIDLRAEFLKIFSRISSQRFSFGLSSGEYGGRKSSETLPGSARSLQRWLGAPSRTKRISCLASFRDRAVRKT